MQKKDKILLTLAAMGTALAGFISHTQSGPVWAFLITTAALILVAMIVGLATEQLGHRTGPAVTGILQSALGNLPELFVCIFALRAGMDTVVKATLVGSILGNSILVLGFALLFGGLKNGTQKFQSGPPKMIATLMLLAFAAMAIPTLTRELHTPADIHLETLDVIVALVLLVVFIASLKFSIMDDSAIAPTPSKEATVESWPMMTTLVILLGAGVAAAFVSDWFVTALQPAMNALGINEVFAGLIIVAIAGNAIENFVGIQLAIKNKADYAISVILNSSLQIALLVYPILVIVSLFLGGAVLSFVLSPLLLACLALSVIVSALIVFDGVAIWLEGLALIGLYIIIATAFWWG